jgi:hypothetical protein
MDGWADQGTLTTLGYRLAERSQEEYQYRQEGTPGPHGEQSPTSSGEPQTTRTQQGGNSDKGH